MTTAEKLVQIAQNEQKIYDKGFNDGKAQGGGGDSYYDTFWDSFQTKGNRNSYNYGFAGEGWNNGTFKPKYPINAVGDASYMFNECALSGYDFVENGVVLDTSKAASLTYCFRECKGITRLGVIDCTGCNDLNRTFYSCKVETIDKLIVNENVKFSNTFDYTGSLVNITFEGTIGKNGLSMKSTVLSKASIESVINCLSTTTTGLAVTLSLGAVNKAFETSEGALDGSSSAEWATLIGTKTNWTITLS